MSMTVQGNDMDRCDRCHLLLEPIPNVTTPGSIQFDNVLIVRFEGGYGMFVDPLPTEERLDARGLHTEYDSLLCHECAHALALFLGKDPSNWHTHRAGSGQHDDHHDLHGF
jgi:hypothetical protein